MIEYITGKITSLTPATAVIETRGGVAYLLNITLPTYAAIQGKEDARLLVHEAIREDAWVLFGFLDERERSLFRELIGVSGVGASTARIILSSIPAQELELVISTGQENRLKAVKGIGQKTAQRIIVDLKGKIKPVDNDFANSLMPQTGGETFDEALSALVILGFQKAACQKALKKIFDTNPASTVEDAIRKALTML